MKITAVQAFLDEYQALCNKHNMSLDTDHNGFLVESLSEGRPQRRWVPCKDDLPQKAQDGDNYMYVS
jgi:hypothetical protein